MNYISNIKMNTSLIIDNVQNGYNSLYYHYFPILYDKYESTVESFNEGINYLNCVILNYCRGNKQLTYITDINDRTFITHSEYVEDYE